MACACFLGTCIRMNMSRPESLGRASDAGFRPSIEISACCLMRLNRSEQNVEREIYYSLLKQAKSFLLDSNGLTCCYMLLDAKQFQYCWFLCSFQLVSMTIHKPTVHSINILYTNNFMQSGCPIRRLPCDVRCA